MELPPRAGTMLGKVRQCAQIMDELFRTLLDISELDAGAVRPQVGAFALAALFARARLEFEPQARAKGIELRVRRCAEYVRSDPVLVERILRNLISNAIRYTERGRVVVGCRPKDLLCASVFTTPASASSLVNSRWYSRSSIR